MRPAQAFDKILLKKCSRWDTFDCPHMGSELMLLSIIRTNVNLMADLKLVQDLNGLCGNCCKFRSLYQISSSPGTDQALRLSGSRSGPIQGSAGP
jgi:hypothetical protein